MNKQTMHTEISVIPMGTISGMSMSKEIADAFDAIHRVKGYSKHWLCLHPWERR
jgi:hypothetical protein